MSAALLSPSERATAVQVLDTFALESAAASDLLAEMETLLRDLARYRLALQEDDFTDDQESERLTGGIAYANQRIAEIGKEIDRRSRALRFGYRPDRVPAAPDLPERFARIRAEGPIPFVSLVETETEQVAQRRGRRWWMCCPFHAERNASFAIHDDGGGYCFACRWSGDQTAFVARWRGLSMLEALIFLERGLA